MIVLMITYDNNQYINIKNAKLVIYNVSFVNALVKEMLNMFHYKTRDMVSLEFLEV